MELYKDKEKIFIPINGRFRANNGDILCQAALNNQGIVQLPGFIATPFIQQKKLIPILQTYEPKAAAVYAIYPKTSPNELANANIY